MHDHVVAEIREDIPKENMMFCNYDDVFTFTDLKNNKYNVIRPMEGLVPEFDSLYKKWYWVEEPE